MKWLLTLLLFVSSVAQASEFMTCTNLNDPTDDFLITVNTFDDGTGSVLVTAVTNLVIAQHDNCKYKQLTYFTQLTCPHGTNTFAATIFIIAPGGELTATYALNGKNGLVIIPEWFDGYTCQR